MAFLGWIVRWSLRNRPTVVVATLLFVLFGVRAALLLPIDAVPDVTNVQVQVITTAPALSPVEVEQYVSIPVERAMAGIPKTVQVRSISKYGLSVVTVVFRDDTDIYFSRQLVNERMRDAQDAVPAQYGKPQVGPITTGLGEVYQFTVENDALTLMQLEEILDWQIAPQLKTVPGVVELNTFGGETRQYQVLLEPSRLQASGVSVADVVRALENSNANAGGGYIEHNREHFVIGTDGLVKNLDDLRRVVIGATPQGVPITVATVGDVQFGPRLRLGAATKDGKGEVVGLTLMLMGENSRVVTEAVKAKVSAILPSLPEGTPDRAPLRPVGARGPHHQDGRAKSFRGCAPRHGGAPPPAGRSAGGDCRGDDDPLVAALRRRRHERDRGFRQSDESRCHRFRPHRRRRRHHRGKRRASPRRETTPGVAPLERRRTHRGHRASDH